ncbi:MAG: hypothetical protein ACT6FC_07255 [Methanosarcinaceae archaeon]
MPEDYREKHNLSKSAHWAFDQRLPGSTPPRQSMPQVSSQRRLRDYGNITMPKDFHSFANKAINIARDVGIEKRQNKRFSDMALLNRQQEGETRRTAIREAGQAPRGARGGSEQSGSGTRMKSFDAANTLMSQMYPEGTNPATGKPFTPEEWRARTIELADERETYGGNVIAEDQAPGMQGRGRVLTDDGRLFDVSGGQITKGNAPDGMMGKYFGGQTGGQTGGQFNIPANNFDYNKMTVPGLRSSANNQSSANQYPTKLQQMGRTPQEGFQEMGKSLGNVYGGARKYLADPFNTSLRYGWNKLGQTGDWMLDKTGLTLKEQRAARDRLSGK